MRSDFIAVLDSDEQLASRWMHAELPTGAYRCPHCKGSSPLVGSPNVCPVCLGNGRVGGELARLYLLEGIEGVRRWMRAWVR